MGHSVYGLSFITLSDSNLVVLDLGLTWARLLSFYNSPLCFRLLCVGRETWPHSRCLGMCAIVTVTSWWHQPSNTKCAGSDSFPLRMLLDSCQWSTTTITCPLSSRGTLKSRCGMGNNFLAHSFNFLPINIH